MPLKRTTRSLIACIALFALLLGALAPALSHALSQPGNGKRMVQVCTVAGMKMVALDDSSAKGKAGDSDLFPAERCAFCATHGGAPAVPPSPILPFGLRGGADPLPSLYFHAPRPLFVWAAAHPRAPPRLHA